MGTRSHTVIKDGKDVLMVMYRQYDGYPSCHGQELCNFMTGMKMVNGFSLSDEEPGIKISNGINCFAAQLLTHFKSKVNRGNKNTIGGIYLYSHKEANDRHDYTYEIIFKDGQFLITVWEWEDKIQSNLTLDEFQQFITDYDQE